MLGVGEGQGAKRRAEKAYVPCDSYLSEETAAELPSGGETTAAGELHRVADPSLNGLLQELQEPVGEAEDGVAPDASPLAAEGSEQVSVGVDLRNDKVIDVEHFTQLRRATSGASLTSEASRTEICVRET